MATASSTSTPAAEPKHIRLSMLTPGGPILAYHVGWIADNALYVHGGIDKAGSKNPLDRLHRFDFSDGTWSEIRSPGSPALSHHTCVLVDGRYAVIVGGWNGHRRSSAVHIFDVTAARWSSPRTMGFPVGAGLSSHAAALLADGTVLVVGREGSLRLQKKFGTAFLLRGNPAVGASGVYQYAEETRNVASRSGHSLHMTGTTVYIVGGRDDQVLEMHQYEKSASSVSCSTLSQLCQRLTPLPSSTTSKPMSGRRHHVSALSAGVLFIHGGWTFDGRSRDPVGHMYAVLTRPTPMRWFYLGDSGVGRAGHVCCCDGDRVLIHGGEGARGIIHCSLFQLELA